MIAPRRASRCGRAALALNDRGSTDCWARVSDPALSRDRRSPRFALEGLSPGVYLLAVDEPRQLGGARAPRGLRFLNNHEQPSPRPEAARIFPGCDLLALGRGRGARGGGVTGARGIARARRG